VTRVGLGTLLGLQKPVDHIAFLEEGRQLVLRQNDNFWLLDFSVALGYADLLARKEASSDLSSVASAAQPAAPTNQPAAAVSCESPYVKEIEMPSGPNPSILALRAELFADNQAWGYAAALLEETAAHAAFDARAPRVNPLLQAHACLLSGQKQKARLACRKALVALVTDSTDYNRMIRYQLQGLLFSQP